MIDAASTTTTTATAFIWGPYIAVVLAAFIGLFGWATRTLINKLNQLSQDVARMKDHQTNTDANVEQVRLDVRGVYDTITRRRSQTPK